MNRRNSLNDSASFASSSLSNYTSSLADSSEKFFKNDKYVNIATVALLAYSGLFVTQISEKYKVLLQHTGVRILLFLAVAYSARLNPAFGIVLSLAVLVTLLSVSQVPLKKEHMRVVSEEREENAQREIVGYSKENNLATFNENDPHVRRIQSIFYSVFPNEENHNVKVELAVNESKRLQESLNRDLTDQELHVLCKHVSNYVDQKKNEQESPKNTEEIVGVVEDSNLAPF